MLVTFIIGLVIGVFVGYITSSLCSANTQDGKNGDKN